MRVKITTLSVCCLAVQLLFSPASSQVPSDFDPHPVFQDEFSGTKLDSSKWNFRDLGQRNHCVNSESAVHVADSHLTITTYSAIDAASGKLTNYCGMISTEATFNLAYGYWEASIRFHRVEGVQEAFWVQSPTIGKNIDRPKESGVEMDIFEHLSEAGFDEFDHAIHWNGYGDHHAIAAAKKSLPGLNDGKFHTFAVAWRPSGYTFYVDGEMTYERNSNQAPVSSTPEYVILSSEIPRTFLPGGYGPSDKSAATFDVDYVRVFRYRLDTKKKGK